jgi:hypothetical protein
MTSSRIRAASAWLQSRTLGRVWLSLTVSLQETYSLGGEVRQLILLAARQASPCLPRNMSAREGPCLDETWPDVGVGKVLAGPEDGECSPLRCSCSSGSSNDD